MKIIGIIFYLIGVAIIIKLVLRDVSYSEKVQAALDEANRK